MTEWRENFGEIPPGMKGTGARVHVELFNGMRPPESWPADTGKWQNTNWKISRKPHPFEIRKWKPA